MCFTFSFLATEEKSRAWGSWRRTLRRRLLRAGVGDAAICVLFELEEADTDIVRLACCFGDREEEEEHDHAARSFEGRRRDKHQNLHCTFWNIMLRYRSRWWLSRRERRCQQLGNLYPRLRNKDSSNIGWDSCHFGDEKIRRTCRADVCTLNSAGEITSTLNFNLLGYEFEKLKMVIYKRGKEGAGGAKIYIPFEKEEGANIHEALSHFGGRGNRRTSRSSSPIWKRQLRYLRWWTRKREGARSAVFILTVARARYKHQELHDKQKRRFEHTHIHPHSDFRPHPQ